jgi:hypothetical protein
LIYFTTKGVPVMDIYSILSSKPHNPHYLNRYINFIEQCQQKNIDIDEYVERHHILPRAKDMFPEYEDFRLHPWNLAVLTARQHFIAHIMLWKTFPTKSSCIDAIWGMKCRRDISCNSRLYEVMRIEAINLLSSRMKNTMTVKDKDGNSFNVSKDDPRYLSGELVHITTDSATVKDKDGNAFRVPIYDSRFLSGELFGVTKGTTPVRGKNGDVFRVKKDDHRFLSGELVHTLKDSVSVKDKNGNTLNVSVNDPRYLSGELVGVAKGMVTVKDKDGKTFSVHKDDPRYLSGELVGVAKGMVTVKDKDGNVFKVRKDDPYYLSNDFSGVAKGTIVVKDKNGKTFRTTKDDPRYLSGEFVGVAKGLKWFNNGISQVLLVPGSEPFGFRLGMLSRKKRFDIIKHCIDAF